MGIRHSQKFEGMIWLLNNTAVQNILYDITAVENVCSCTGMWMQIYRNFYHSGQETTGALEAYHKVLKVTISRALHIAVSWQFQIDKIEWSQVQSNLARPVAAVESVAYLDCTPWKVSLAAAFEMCIESIAQTK